MSKSPVLSPENLLLPNNLERRRIFHLLKKSSSYTAWKRIFGFWQKWVDVTERSVKEASERGLLPKTVYPLGYTSQPDKEMNMCETSIHHSDYVRILKNLALVREGVTRLSKGDKRVFTHNNAHGLFSKAGLELDDWDSFKDWIDSRGTIWEEEKSYSRYSDWKEGTPLTDEFFEAMRQAQWASDECGRYIIEQRDFDTPALFSYGLWEIVFLPKLPYPAVLPEVPEPEEDIVTKTGSAVAYSGIWEPVVGAATKGFIFKKAVGPFTRVGPLNYLHAGTLAPLLRQTYRNPKDKKLGCDSVQTKVTWRLIWRDDRYEDGTIPEEEKEYRFVRPVQSGEEDFFDVDPWKYLRAHDFPNPFHIKPTTCTVPGGNPCTKEGWWWTPAGISSDIGRRYFKKGEIMPDFKSDYGMVIWQWIGRAGQRKTR
jgi:hypothetical protein